MNVNVLNSTGFQVLGPHYRPQHYGIGIRASEKNFYILHIMIKPRERKREENSFPLITVINHFLAFTEK